MAQTKSKSSLLLYGNLIALLWLFFQDLKILAADEYLSEPIPALFIFGDSLVDVGNNNYITSIATCDFLPYGIDFPTGPSGRFCNGKIFTDFLSEFFSLPFPPPYLAPTTRGNALLRGVNYGSAAGGILRSSGYNSIGRVDLDTQITWFANNIQDMQKILGLSETQALLSKSLYVIAIGSNDYINNYLARASPISLLYTPEQYQQILLDKFSSQLAQLYKLGVRSVAISSLGPLGCIPSQLAKRSVNGECSSFVNSFASNFNQGLRPLLQKLNSNLQGARFIYVDSFTPVLAYRNNPPAYGFKFGASACCGGGRFNGQLVCLPSLKPCPDRSDHVWWDPYHPTEAVNRLLANNTIRLLQSN